jgi:transposase-like protein
MGPADLRAAARQCNDARQASRILAIAMVAGGFSREDAARLCGMDRQTLRDWVHRYNKEGLDGITDRAWKAAAAGGHLFLAEKEPVQKHRRPASLSRTGQVCILDRRGRQSRPRFRQLR